MLLFLLAFIPRALFVLLSTHPDPAWSPHWNLASGLLKFETFGYYGERVTNIEPGYPFFLAAARFLFQENLPGTLLFQAAFSALGAVFLFHLALELCSNRRVAWLSAFFYSFYPYLIGQTASLIEVPVFTTLLIASVFFYVRAFNQPQSFLSSALCGTVFGLTLLTRSMVLPAFCLCLAVFFFQKKWRVLIIVFLVSAACVAPWSLRSHSIDGSWIPPRGGWNFLQGNCPYSAKIIPAYNPDILDAYVSRLLEKERPDLIEEEKETDGKQADDLFKNKAYEFIRQNPGVFIQQKLKNAVYLFYPRIVPFYSMDENTRIEFSGESNFDVVNPRLRSMGQELAYSLTYAPLFLLALAGMYLRRKHYKEDLVFYFIILNFTVVYALCWPATRLRAPLDFIFMFYAAHALSLWKSFRAA